MREGISTRTRFEIFKRDGFQCQYCGQKPPGIILHVDHIVPVSKGGESTDENLITSCSSCNLGKSDVPLERVVQPLKETLEAELERTRQMDEYNAWLTEIRAKKEDDFRQVSNAIVTATGQDCDEVVISGDWAKTVRMFLKKMPRELIIEAVEIAHDRLCFQKRATSTFKYFCGVCWRRIKEAEGIE